MLAEEIEKAWTARAKGAPFYTTPTFVGGALKFGAETDIVCAKAGSPFADRVENESGAVEARAIALLAAAFLQPISERTAGHLRRALHKRAKGDDLTASIHLALMGLPRLNRQDGAARRLFAADSLMSAGVTPETIFAALDLDHAVLAELIRKYNPDQPRVPAGNGRISGQWTHGAESGEATSTDSPRESAPSSTGQTQPPNQKDDHSTIFSVRRWDSYQHIVSDANPDPIKPGQQYAQTSETYSVETSRVDDPRIDRITDTLMKTLQVVSALIPQGSGPLYGTALHVLFANAVRALNLPGVEVEQSFDLSGIADYGDDGSIRTDIILMDTVQDEPIGIAVWDLKTGRAKLTASRVNQLRSMIPGGGKAWFFELRADRILQRLARSAFCPSERREAVVDRRQTGPQTAVFDYILD